MSKSCGAYDAYNRGDLDAALKHAASGCELDWSRGVGPNAGVYKLDQMRSFLDDFTETFESVRVEPDEFIDAGDDVVVPQTGYIRGHDGVEATARVSLVWTCRDGAIVRICLYQQRREALEAAGLSE
jgi:ketosteroid isomerase-like protein